MGVEDVHCFQKIGMTERGGERRGKKIFFLRKKISKKNNFHYFSTKCQSIIHLLV